VSKSSSRVTNDWNCSKSSLLFSLLLASSTKLLILSPLIFWAATRPTDQDVRGLRWWPGRRLVLYGSYWEKAIFVSGVKFIDIIGCYSRQRSLKKYLSVLNSKHYQILKISIEYLSTILCRTCLILQWILNSQREK